MMSDHELTDEHLAKIVDQAVEKALSAQRRELFRVMGDATGYDLGNPEHVQEVRKDLYMVRKTRQRSERFQAAGEKVFFMMFWGGLASALIYGGIELIRRKLGGS